MHARHAGKLCLAIETSNPGSAGPASGPGVAIGLLGADRASTRALAVERLREVGRNEDDLLPAIDRACAAAGVRPPDLRAVAVSIGPGGYTSLRVACATAKMIAEAGRHSGVECIAVPTTLAVWAAAQPTTEPTSIGILLAGKDRTAHLTVIPAPGWTPADPFPEGALITAEMLPLEQVRFFLGDRHVPGDIRRRILEAGIQIAEPIFDAVNCLQIAAELPATDPVDLIPAYPREPDAITLWRARKAELGDKTE